jgi:peptidoglycan/LPS O-acetylase OafA/YrhL
VEGVRGLAALSVLLFHSWGFTTTKSPREVGVGIPILDGILGRLSLGLTAFFVLSGFLLFRQFLGQDDVDLHRYAKARFLRIVPAYWTALVIVIAISARPFTPADIARNFLFLQSYNAADPNASWVIFPAWSLCIEVSFYALLPALAYVALRFSGGRTGRLIVFCAALATIGPAYRAWCDWAGWPPLALPATIDEFGAGMILAVLCGRVTLRGRLPSLTLAAAAGVMALALLDAPPTSLELTDPRHPFFYTLVAIAIALALASFLLADRPTRLGRALTWRPIAILGVISYGVYLWHSPVIHALNMHGGLGAFMVVATVTVLASLLIAAASWVLIERPTLALKDTRVRVWARSLFAS